MQISKRRFEIDTPRMLNIAAVCMFAHVLCGLLRYLMNVAFVLAVDYSFSLVMIAAMVLYAGKRRERMKRYFSASLAQKLLCFVFAWCILSALVNLLFVSAKNVYFTPNALLDTFWLVFVFFPYGRFAAKNGVNPLALRLLCTLIFLWSAFMAVALAFVFAGKVMQLPGGIQVGIYAPYVSFSVNNNPNHTSCIESVFLLLCLLMGFKSKKRSRKILFGLLSLIHYTGLVLSNSRDYFLTTLLLIAAMSFFSVRYLTRDKGMLRSVFLSLGAAACVGLAFYYARHLTFLFQTASEEKPLVDNKIETLSGRTRIWTSGVRSVFSDPLRYLFGVGPANSKSVTMEYLGRELYTHNQFLEIAVCLGMPALAAFIAFVIKTLADGAGLILRRTPELMTLFIVGYICILLAANMFEALLLFYRRPGSYAFYMMAGWVCERARMRKSAVSAPQLP